MALLLGTSSLGVYKVLAVYGSQLFALKLVYTAV